jgi:hypothetical protein
VVVQASGFEPPTNHVLREPQLSELPRRDHTLLPRRKFNKRTVPPPASGHFRVDMT